ncbi:MAG: Uma2 family endonuclease [Lyngbya sp. HA4199-MV5]|jgi:Uma2 family endonuclease|nr:Uma2 family endonuclease [Lyngbya sp. HA4199-MV5]
MVTSPTLAITWEKLPDDFVLDDDPVDNINQPLLAAALSESLQLNGKLPANALTTTNYGICATVNEKIVVKAPDWSYIPAIRVPRTEVDRSYTPQLQGDIPAVVIEFLSAMDGGEYSVKPTHPPGKWLFYEQILAVPTYVIFALDTGVLEVYHLNDAGRYQLSTPDANNRYWIAQMNLFLGVWQGTRENRTGNWLRWWDEDGNLLLWGVEKAALLQEQAEQQRQRADRLAAQLRAAGIDPES